GARPVSDRRRIENVFERSHAWAGHVRPFHRAALDDAPDERRAWLCGDSGGRVCRRESMGGSQPRVFHRESARRDLVRPPRTRRRLVEGRRARKSAVTPIIRVGIIADDLTGAGDTAVQFVRAGWKTELQLRPRESAADVIAVTTDSRGRSERDAAEAVSTAVTRLRSLHVTRIYKKIDSTLRGHVRAEVQAALRVLAEAIALLGADAIAVGSAGLARHLAPAWAAFRLMLPAVVIVTSLHEMARRQAAAVAAAGAYHREPAPADLIEDGAWTTW